MKNIDFLPEIYRERKALAHARIWWGIVVVIFSAAIGSTAGAQYLLRQSIQRQIDELADEFESAQEQVTLLAHLQKENRTAGELAGLVTYLEHPWPRTQLLAEIVRPLPDSIHLTELVIDEEEITKPVTPEAGPRRRGARPSDQPAARLAAAVADLETLRRTYDAKVPVIEITGTVADVAVLHDYVTALGRSALITRAQIKSLESAATVVQDKPTQFTLHLVFRPTPAQQPPPIGSQAGRSQAAARDGGNAAEVAATEGGA